MHYNPLWLIRCNTSGILWLCRSDTVYQLYLRLNLVADDFLSSRKRPSRARVCSKASRNIRDRNGPSAPENGGRRGFVIRSPRLILSGIRSHPAIRWRRRNAGSLPGRTAHLLANRPSSLTQRPNGCDEARRRQERSVGIFSRRPRLRPLSVRQQHGGPKPTCRGIGGKLPSLHMHSGRNLGTG